jgi:hypothetical protein
VVQRRVLVEGTPEAVAYETESGESDGNGPSVWIWILVAIALLVGIYLFGALLRRRSSDEAKI